MSHQYSPAFERAGRFVAKHAKLVVLAWLAVGVLVNTAWPQLERVANEHSVSPLPTGEVSPALASMKEMGKAFGRPGIDNAVIIVMHGDKGFDADAQARYSALIERLRGTRSTSLLSRISWATRECATIRWRVSRFSARTAPPGMRWQAWPATSVLHWRSGHFAPWMTW